MSFFERVFGKVNDWVRASEKKRRSEFMLSFDDLYPSIVVFSQGALASDQTPLLLKSQEVFGALYGHTLLLPREFGPFDDVALNRDLFLHKSLVGGILRSLGIITVADRRSVAQRALEIALLRERVEREAERVFPEYAEWSEQLMLRHQAALSHSALPAQDVAWLRVQAKLAERLSALSATGEVRAAQLRDLVSEIQPELLRELDRLPEVALAPWCEPIQHQTLLEENAQDGARDRGQGAKTEKEGRSASEIEVVDLEKEKKKENPVTHSFEKLETADEYQGGYKTVDASDELEEQQNALDELDLKKVTRGGDAAAANYRADIADLVRTNASSAQKAKSIQHVYYPEWDYQARELKPRYCRLYLEAPEPVSDLQGDEFLTRVKAQHATGLEEWKHRLESLVNQRRWRDRQWEGSEISIDAFVRYWSDVRLSGAGDARFYHKMLPALRDFSCLILLDQSYSTDSWVMNRRVLDVELESLALISELLAPLREPVAVAGTWSETRNHCHFRLYKNFDDSWSRFLNHAPEITPQGYTRLGPAIRHATRLLADKGGKHKLLVLLTDGKPTDYDRYEGRYGIEDIHHACLEAAQSGVSMRALAVEKEAKNYFPHLFGPRDFQILQDPAKLPEQLFRIYLETLRA